jgi:hypothetical protein
MTYPVNMKNHLLNSLQVINNAVLSVHVHGRRNEKIVTKNEKVGSGCDRYQDINNKNLLGVTG